MPRNSMLRIGRRSPCCIQVIPVADNGRITYGLTRYVKSSISPRNSMLSMAALFVALTTLGATHMDRIVFVQQVATAPDYQTWFNVDGHLW